MAVGAIYPKLDQGDCMDRYKKAFSSETFEQLVQFSNFERLNRLKSNFLF